MILRFNSGSLSATTFQRFFRGDYFSVRCTNICLFLAFTGQDIDFLWFRFQSNSFVSILSIVKSFVFVNDA